MLINLHITIEELVDQVLSTNLDIPVSSPSEEPFPAGVDAHTRDLLFPVSVTQLEHLSARVDVPHRHD